MDEPNDGSIIDELAALDEAIGPGAGSLAGALMLHSTRGNLDLMNQLYEGEVDRHEQTQRRLNEALAELRKIRHRCAWLAGEVDYLDEDTVIGAGPFR